MGISRALLAYCSGGASATAARIPVSIVEARSHHRGDRRILGDVAPIRRGTTTGIGDRPGDALGGVEVDVADHHRRAASARATAQASPIPDPAPVTSAPRPLRSSVTAISTVWTMSADRLHAFRVEVGDAEIADLRARLHRTRWPDQLPGTTWELGTERSFLERLCAHWADDFDVAAFVDRCNRFPQVRTVIDGATIHAIVAESTAEDPLPLLLLHGWPGSVAEYFDVIEPLRARHRVIVASLPGYGFSGPTERLGIGPAEIAALMVELMDRLGHPRFVAAGGDWGAIVTSWLAAEHAEHIVGAHMTLLPAPRPEGASTAALGEREQGLLRRASATMGTGSAYQAIHATRPQSLAYGLTDSPAGLAGWIIEKFYAWSDLDDGDLESVYTLDRLLENISIYWFTGTINSSTRLYMEAFAAGKSPFHGKQVTVPTGHAQYPGELYPTPRAWAEPSFNIVHWQEMERGGHFAAMELPTVYAADLDAFTAALDA